MILSYERRSHFPTRIGNLRFRVDDDGAVHVQVNRAEPALDHDWTGDYPPAPAATVTGARRRIDELVARHGFAALPERTDDEYDDGFEERLTYWPTTGPARTVVVDRATVPAFRALIADLGAALGITDALA